VFLLPGAVELHRYQFAPPKPVMDESPHSGLAPRVQVADRVEAHDTLSLEGPIEEVFERLPLGRGSGQPLPAEMAVDQLVGLHDASAPADGHLAPEERQLERPLGGLPAGPQVLLVHQLVVVDVADRERSAPADQP